jgi:hypothetical protein
MTNKKIKLEKTDGKLGFVSEEGIFVTDPFESECGRFMMDPIKDYGLTQKQVDEMVKANDLEEELGIWSDFALEGLTNNMGGQQ